MAKKGVYKISGNTNPTIGEKTFYTVEEWYPDTSPSYRNSAKVTWELFVKGDNGFVSTNIKKKGINHFTFGAKAHQFTYKIEGYLYKPEGNAPMSLIVQPQKDEPPKQKEKDILGVSLTYEDGSKITKALSYRDRLKATAKCEGMEGDKVIFSLWEDDSAKSGHNKDNQHIIKSPPIEVNKYGKAVWVFSLSPTFISLANKKENDKKQHEYYVTAEYNGKTDASGNVNVDNPEYRPSVSNPTQPKTGTGGTSAHAPKPKPAIKPKKDTPKASTKPGSPNNQADKKGNITSVMLADAKGKAFVKTPKFGETIQIIIEGKDLIGKKYNLRIWEHDLVGKNDLLYNEVHTFKADKQIVLTSLTKKMEETGKIGNDPKNPDSGEYTAEWNDHQEIFAEVVFLHISSKSSTIDVGLEEEPKPADNKKTPVEIEKKNVPQTKSGCLCQEQYKDLVWGEKVSCDFRKKVVEICTELWREKPLDMANELMTCMALETMKAFSPDVGYPNATGLVQFTSGKYGAITAMNETGYNGGKIITKDYLKNLSAVEQLKYVKLYFQMWMEKYGKTINDALDMYMTIWCPSAVGKPDTFICYSAERDKKSGNDFYSKNKSAEYEYYDENEKIATNRLKKDSNKGNGEISKGELRPRLKYWKELGKSNKVIVFNCNGKQNKEPIIIENASKIVFFDNSISEDRKVIVSQKTSQILEKAAKASSNDKILITSTIRSTRRQAEAMYANESSGNHIRYASPGREIINIYNKSVKDGNSKEVTISKMDKRIAELSNEGKRVSLHCVSDEVYKHNNILDISFSRYIKNPRDFIKELSKDVSLSKIIHPLNNVVSGDKIVYDSGEKAIHVEIKN